MSFKKFSRLKFNFSKAARFWNPFGWSFGTKKRCSVDKIHRQIQKINSRMLQRTCGFWTVFVVSPNFLHLFFRLWQICRFERFGSRKVNMRDFLSYLEVMKKLSDRFSMNSYHWIGSLIFDISTTAEITGNSVGNLLDLELRYIQVNFAF